MTASLDFGHITRHDDNSEMKLSYLQFSSSIAQAKIRCRDLEYLLLDEQDMCIINVYDQCEDPILLSIAQRQKPNSYGTLKHISGYSK